MVICDLLCLEFQGSYSYIGHITEEGADCIYYGTILNKPNWFNLNTLSPYVCH